MPTPLPLPDPPLGDGVVALRPWAATDADVAVLAEAWADPEIQRWTAVPQRRDEEAARRWLEGTPKLRAAGLSLDLLVVAVDDGRPLGEVGLSGLDDAAGTGEVGWWVLAGERGSGLAARAVRLLAEWALAPPLALTTVLADVDPTNVASLRVAERAGFSPSGNGPWCRG